MNEATTSKGGCHFKEEYTNCVIYVVYIITDFKEEAFVSYVKQLLSSQLLFMKNETNTRPAVLSSDENMSRELKCSISNHSYGIGTF